jgi:hypothetical protein
MTHCHRLPPTAYFVYFAAFFFGAAVFFFAGPHVPHLAISASSYEGKQGRRIVQRRKGGNKGGDA